MPATLNGKIRESTGRASSRKARRESYLPAVLYGIKDHLCLVVQSGDLRKVIDAQGRNGLIDLSIDGDSLKNRKVILQDYQVNPLQDSWVHADFLEVDMAKKVRVQVPIVLKGHSPGEKLGGLINHITKILDIECLPADIPNEIELDMTQVELHQVVHVSELKVTENLDVLVPPDRAVVSVYIEKVKEEKPEEGEEEAAVEGEAPETDQAETPPQESKKEESQ